MSSVSRKIASLFRVGRRLRRKQRVSSPARRPSSAPLLSSLPPLPSPSSPISNGGNHATKPTAEIAGRGVKAAPEVADRDTDTDTRPHLSEVVPRLGEEDAMQARDASRRELGRRLISGARRRPVLALRVCVLVSASAFRAAGTVRSFVSFVDVMLRLVVSFFVRRARLFFVGLACHGGCELPLCDTR